MPATATVKAAATKPPKVKTPKPKKAVATVADKQPQAVPMLVAYILDRSGSMGAVRDQTISGFNEYIGDLKQQYQDAPERGEIFVTLTTFNNHASIIYSDKPIMDVEELTTSNYHPVGATALYDAIGETLKELGSRERVLKLRKQKATIVVIIQTDGEENASRFFSQPVIFKSIAEYQDRGWTFTFAGADMDAYKASASLGISHGNTLSYGGQHTNSALRSASRGTGNIRNESYLVGRAVTSDNFYAEQKSLTDEEILARQKAYHKKRHDDAADKAAYDYRKKRANDDTK